MATGISDDLRRCRRASAAWPGRSLANRYTRLGAGALWPGRNAVTKLKLGPLTDDKPVKISIELPAAVHRDLVAYANVTIVHPGHGASGPKEPMFDDERLYLRTCRAI